MRVSEILARKRNTTFTVKPDDTIASLSHLLRTENIGAAVVSRNGKVIDGVVSERDVAQKLSLGGSEFAALHVASIMTARVITCRPTDEAFAAAATMLARNIRHLPVIDEQGDLIGMVSMRDVLSVRISELQEETAKLRSFVETQHEPQDRE